MSQASPPARSKSPAKSLSAHNVTEMMDPNETSSKTLSPNTPRRKPSTISVLEDEDHNTIPDPRSRALSPAAVTQSSSPNHHPDLDQEVATLSTKLINAINHQTTLDDTLSSTRQELEAALDHIAHLEELVAKQREKLDGDVWMRRSVSEQEKADLRSRLSHERVLRFEAEKDKKKIEQELENLTVSLFEEANKMVITAKEEAAQEHDILQRKNEQLKAQLKDTEGLLLFQQEQLAELKLVMEQMNAERDDRTGTTPSSPGFSRFDSRDNDGRISDSDVLREMTEPLSPTYPTSLSHLLSPVLRTDITAYDDFIALIRISKTQPHKRASSGSYNGLNPVLGLVGTSIPSNGSTTSLSAAGGTVASNSSPQTPNTPGSSISVGSTTPAVPLPALKETKFYKRALAEDIEPTLRLDTAPGLSWLARRSVITAITEGTLVVEPVPTTGVFATISKPQFYTCSLCGESRRDEAHLRNHRFRTTESETAQRYPLCKYCLSRVRSTCDFLGFLRMVKDGHWRADDEDGERHCWEESVKLREQMFWSRIGGGVVLATHVHTQQGSTAEKSNRNSAALSHTAQDNIAEAVTLDPPVESVQASAEPSNHAPVDDSTPTPAPETKQTDVVSETTLAPELKQAEAETQVAEPSENSNNIQASPEKELGTRLSITIPGAFALNV